MTGLSRTGEWLADYVRDERKLWGVPMTTITVDFWKAPKEGSKWASVKAGERWYSYDKTKMTLAKGKTYEVETTSTDKDGRTYYGIVDAKEKAGSSENGATGDRWWMPFVSNTVAHAIQAAQITDPMQIKTWAAAAKQAALEIEKSSAPDREPGQDDQDDPFG